MKPEDNKYYVYQHVREVDNQIFYIGIGTKNFNKSIRWQSLEFSRAYNKNSRSVEWKECILNSDGYRVEILLQSNDMELCKETEKELIKLHGRIDLGTGTLVNKKPGGDTQFTPSKRYGSKNNAAQPVLQYDLGGNFIKKFDTIIQASIETGVKYNKISNCVCLERVKTGGGFIWVKYKRGRIKKKIEAYFHKYYRFASMTRGKKVCQLSLKNKKIKIWNSLKEAARGVKGDSGNIKKCIIGKNRTSKGFKWKLV